MHSDEKQQNDNNLYCGLHSEFHLQFIFFGEKQNRNSRMLCEKCMIDIINNQEKIQNLVSLQDFKNNPVNSLLRAAINTQNKKQIVDNEALQEIEKLLTKLEESLKSQLIIIRQKLQKMKELLGSMNVELFNNLQINDVAKQFELIKNLDNCQETNELVQLEEQLNQISINLIQSYDEAKENFKHNQLLIINDCQKKFKIISGEVESTIKTSIELLNQMVTFGIPLTVYADIYQFPQIHQQISEGKQIQYQQLYQGTRDGLNVQTYWSKCNLQSHLLTIMTSKNGNIFGGYSPCIINKELNNWVQDPTLKSFVFQYNKKEIYKLTKQTHAVYCNAGYGPTYGGGCDVYVAVDFNSGHSHSLGHSYDISGYNIRDKTTHIFGATTPQLQEIKVYKVIF